MAAISRVPVVMFHTVDKPDANWIWDELTCPVSLFQGKLEGLRTRGYRATSLDEVVAEQSSASGSRERRVVLTFDDGYLDNWVYVYPLMKRMGWKGTVYVNPEFVDPGEEPRRTLEDVWSGKCTEGELQTRGFLNWAEIDALDRSGVLEIASHSMSHTWYPTGPEILDFHRPGVVTPWLAWNARPDRKAFYRNEDQSGFAPWGTPIHRNGRSLGVRRYFPDPDVARSVTEHVAAKGGASFFLPDGWRQELATIAQQANGGRGRAETDDEMISRFEWEIKEAARILEARLGRPVRHFCWPGGAYCDESWDVATGAGVQSLTVKRNDHLRWFSDDPRVVRRISEYRHFSFLGRRLETESASLLPVACDVELGRAGASLELRLRKAIVSLAGFSTRVRR